MPALVPVIPTIKLPSRCAVPRRRPCRWLAGLAVDACIAFAIAGAAQPSRGATLAAGTAAVHPESLTVAQCVALARAAAPEVRARAGDREAARLDSLAAERDRPPNYAIFGGTLIAPSGFYDPVITNLGEYALKLGMAMPLLDAGERRRGREQAALAAATALAELERAGRDAGVRTAVTALGLLRQHELEDSDRETLSWLERLASLIESAVRSGARDRADLTRVQLERDAVTEDLLSLVQVRDALGRELAELTGGASAGAIVVAGSDSSVDAPPAAADSLLLLERVARSPEVRAARFAEANERLALDQARRKNALRVDLALDAGLSGADLTRAVPEEFALTHPGASFADRLRRDLGASLALEFRRPVLDPSARPGIEAREAAVQAAAARTAAASAGRERGILDLLGRWRAAATKLVLTRSSLTRAEEHLLRLRSLYAGGASSLLELLDARRQVDDARARLADSRLEVRSARWEGELQR